MAQRNQPKQKSFTPAPSPALRPKSAAGNHLTGDPFTYAPDALSSDPLFWDGRDRDPTDPASYAPSTPESRAAFVAQLAEQRKTHPMMQGRFARQVAAENARERGTEAKEGEGRSTQDYNQKVAAHSLSSKENQKSNKKDEPKYFTIDIKKAIKDGKIDESFLKKLKGNNQKEASEALMDLTLMQIFNLSTLIEATALRKKYRWRWEGEVLRVLDATELKRDKYGFHTDKFSYFTTKFFLELKKNALKRLAENQQLLHEEEVKYSLRARPQEEKYNPRSRPQTASGDLQRLRQVAQKDQQLIQVQRTQEQKLADTERGIQTLNLTAGSLQAARPEEVDREFTQPLKELRDQKEILSFQVAELKNVRTVLRTAYPALVGVNTETLTPETQDDKLRYDIAQKFNSIRGAIAQVRKKVQEDDGFLLELDDLVNATKAKLTDQEGEREIVLAWLKEQNQGKTTINILLAGTTIALGIGAFFTGGLLGIGLGVAGAAVGLGTAAVQLKESSELYTAAEAGQVGNALVGDPEAAKFNYYLSWVNLVLSGLDVGITARTAISVLKTSGATKVLSRLTREQRDLLGTALGRYWEEGREAAQETLQALKDNLGGVGQELDEVFELLLQAKPQSANGAPLGISGSGSAVSTSRKIVLADALSDEALEKLLAKYPEWNNVKGFIGTPLDPQNLPLGYSYRVRNGRPELYRADAKGDFPPLTVRDGIIMLQTNQSARLSVFSRYSANFRRHFGRDPEVGFQIHHLIPDAVVREHPLMKLATKYGYSLDRGSNLLDIPATPEARQQFGNLIGHYGSHGDYNRYVTDFLREGASLLTKQGRLPLEKVDPKQLLDLIEEIEGKLRKSIQRKYPDVPIKKIDGGDVLCDNGQPDLHKGDFT